MHIGQGLTKAPGDPAGATASLAAVFDRHRQSGDWEKEEKSVWLMAYGRRGKDKS